jgi:hypothetical protein
VTVKLDPFSWFKRKERNVVKIAENPPQMLETPSTPLVNELDQTPRRAPHPCEYPGHEYHPLHKSAREILLVCTRCAESKRIPLRAPLPPPAQPRFAHLA